LAELATSKAAAEPVVADPAPLGLAGFAMTTFVLSVTNANIWHAQLSAVGLAIAYGGLAQLLAGMWEFRRGNVFGALAFTSYGAFWISYYVLVEFLLKSVPAADLATTLGTYLCGWTIFTFYMTIAALRVNGAVLAVFVLLTITFLLLTLGAFWLQTSVNWTKAGGWVGIATAAAAWYASFAGVTNSTFKKTVIPVWPLAR
jgi:succinate-acetate transporter protein